MAESIGNKITASWGRKDSASPSFGGLEAVMVVALAAIVQSAPRVVYPHLAYAYPVVARRRSVRWI